VTDETYGLRLQYLKEINPKMSRVAVLWNPDAINKKALQATKDAAERFDVTVTSYEVRTYLKIV
jgi:ABC-type uncharacterized transport system substrate-binding protein